MGTDYYILTQSSSDHSSTSSSSWLGLFNRGSLRAQSPLSAAGSHAGILPPTGSNSNWNWPKPSVAPGYIIIYIISCLSAPAVPLLIYTGASLDWRLGRGSICNKCFHIFKPSWHCRGGRLPPMSVLDMTSNHLMVRLQPWRFGEGGVPFPSHYSRVHSNPEW